MRNSKHPGSSPRSSGRIVAPCDGGKLAAEIMRERENAGLRMGGVTF